MDDDAGHDLDEDGGEPERDQGELAQQLAEGALDPDEAPPGLEPWDEGADDET